MTKLLFTIDSALSSMRFSTSGRQLWYCEEKPVFRDTVVYCSIKEHMFLPSPSSTPSVLGKKDEVKEDTAWLVILEKEVSNNSWEPLKFLLLRNKKTVGANTVESSDFLKYAWPEFYKSLQISLGCRCSCHLKVFSLKHLFSSYQYSNDFQFMGGGLPVEDSYFHLLGFPQDLILSKNKYCKVALHQEESVCHRGKWADRKGSMAAEVIWRRMLLLCCTFTWSDLKRAGEGSQVTSFCCAGDIL